MKGLGLRVISMAAAFVLAAGALASPWAATTSGPATSLSAAE